MTDDTVTATFHRPPEGDVVIIALDDKGNYSASSITKQTIGLADRNGLALMLIDVIERLESVGTQHG